MQAGPNAALIQAQLDSGAPVGRIVSTIAETFFFVEDRLERLLASEQGEDLVHALAHSLALSARALQQLALELPTLRLSPNVNFLVAALKRGQPPEDLFFFLARSLDAIRTPIDALPAEAVARPEVRGALRALAAAIQPISAL